MLNNYPRYASLLLALGLAACSTTTGTSSQRVEGTYAFGKPPPAPAAPVENSRVAAVTAQPLQGKKGPDNVAHIVYFDFDSYTVRPTDRSIVESHARWLRSNPQQSLVLQGHTDARGGIEYNLALGHKRAEAVRSSLQLLGVEPRRVEAVSYGKEQLADPGSSDAAHQRNRRVEFEYR